MKRIFLIMILACAAANANTAPAFVSEVEVKSFETEKNRLIEKCCVRGL